MLPLRPISTLLALAICVSCAELNYPIEEPALDPTAGSQNGAFADGEGTEPLRWSDLTRLARAHQQLGELDQAAARLSQAATQVSALPPTHAQRRTVFGLRARLAIEIAESGDLEVADTMADELFAEAEASPELGGSALVSLAVSVAERRGEAAREAGQPDSQLALLQIALTTAQASSINRDRMELAAMVADVAYREDDIAIARNAIDQALSDADHLIPTNKKRIAWLQLEHARIALAGGDFDTAKKSATAANRTLDSVKANASTRGIAEATLAEILSETGEDETALVIATGANARIGGDEALTAYAQRRILAALARVEGRMGNRQASRMHFEEALAIPGQDLPADVALVKELTRELDAWDAPEPPAQSSPEAKGN